ncbi:Up-regulated during septation-domain-containing protein [Peziza echinospora]|nr:Up-regulated during septation-domain-containing protein [Peziza echinospora]
MNGSPTSQRSSDSSDSRLAGRYTPAVGTNNLPPAQMLEKYFALSPTEHPRYNPLNKDRPRSSSLLNIDDTVAMHLLVETAIIDSNEYEVLSFEEVEELKKEYKFLSSRIDAAKRKLALESKVRDAALSLSRLYNNKKGKRRSLLGGNEMTTKTDEELVQSNLKVEQLVQELWGLNNRVVEIQRRLLQHGAGILGMTHHGGTKPNRDSKSIKSPIGGIGKNGLPDEDYFDDRSFYRTSDNLEPFSNESNGHRRGPSSDNRYPVARNTMQFETNSPPLDPKVERRLEQLNNELRRFLTGSSAGIELPSIPQSTGNSTGLNQQIAILEQGIKFIQQQPPPAASTSPASEELEQTVTTLWDMMMLGNENGRARRASIIPNGKAPSIDVDSDDEDSEEYGTSFSVNAFSYKVQALYAKTEKLRADRLALRKQLEQQTQRTSEEREAYKQRLQDREEELGMEINKLEGEIDSLNETIISRDKSLTSANQELDTLTDEIKLIQEELRDREDERDQAKEDLATAEQELVSLQKDFQERLQETTQNHDKDVGAVEQEKAIRLALEKQLKAKEEAEDALLAKLRELDTELIARVEMEGILQEKLHEKDALLASSKGSDEAWEQKLKEARDELEGMQEKMEEVKEDRDIFRAELDASKAELDSIVSNADKRFKALENDLNELKRAKEASENANKLTAEECDRLMAEIADKDEQLRKLDEERMELVDTVTRLSTEVALVKAELDEAHGSKSQRAEAVRAAAALEAAGKSQSIDPAFLQELDTLAMQNKALLQEIATLKAERDSAKSGSSSVTQNLEKRNNLLQAELNGMLQDFEGLTKQSIEFENERVQLEGMVDRMKERCEALESALADERVRMLGSSSRSPSVSVGNGELPPPPRSAGESMSTQVLKSEFKKMMRDMRSEHMKNLRAEQEERRKLEGIVRKMKQDAIQSRRSIPTTTVTASSG